MRRGLGVLAGVVTVALAATYVAAAWNPWQLVVLQLRFHDLFLGALLTGIAAYLTAWLLWPIRDEATQRLRMPSRVVILVVVGLSLLGWGLFGYGYETEELARSGDGERALVSVAVKPRGEGADTTRDLHIWAGDGLGTRIVGNLGQACGPVTGRFVTEDTLELGTSYGTWQFDLDPGDGTPLEILGPRCADGPVPATLER